MSEPAKSARSVAMTEAWAKRQAAAAAAKPAAKTPKDERPRLTSVASPPAASSAPNDVAAPWYARPVCLCACGWELIRHKNPERQLKFCVGHDARLKSTAAKVGTGELPRSAISDAAQALKDMIGFLKTRQELLKAF
jgi:hypothetical protein